MTSPLNGVAANEGSCGEPEFSVEPVATFSAPAVRQEGATTQDAPAPTPESGNDSAATGEDARSDAQVESATAANSDVEEETDQFTVDDWLVLPYAVHALVTVSYTSAVIGINGAEQRCGEADLTWYTVGSLVSRLVQIVLFLLLHVYNSFLERHFDQVDGEAVDRAGVAESVGNLLQWALDQTNMLTFLFDGTGVSVIITVAQTCPEDSMLLGLAIFNVIPVALAILWSVFWSALALLSVAPLTTACFALYTLTSFVYTEVVWHSDELDNLKLDLTWYFVVTILGRLLIIIYGMVRGGHVAVELERMADRLEKQEDFRGLKTPYVSEMEENSEFASEDESERTRTEEDQSMLTRTNERTLRFASKPRVPCLLSYGRLAILVCCFDISNVYLFSEVGKLLPDSAVFVGLVIINFVPVALGGLALVVSRGFRTTFKWLLLGR